MEKQMTPFQQYRDHTKQANDHMAQSREHEKQHHYHRALGHAHNAHTWMYGAEDYAKKSGQALDIPKDKSNPNASWEDQADHHAQAKADNYMHAHINMARHQHAKANHHAQLHNELVKKGDNVLSIQPLKYPEK